VELKLIYFAALWGDED